MKKHMRKLDEERLNRMMSNMKKEVDSVQEDDEFHEDSLYDEGLSDEDDQSNSNISHAALTPREQGSPESGGGIIKLQ
jgi:hypothetical protein